MKAVTRRTFLQKSALAAAGASLAPYSWAQVRGANDDIRVAVVGFRGRGKAHINDLLQVKGARIVAFCDVDQSVLDQQVKAFHDKGQKVKAYTDVRKLLESKEIDAISTATPNHWHALMTIWACQAGKDMYVEKPVSHNVWEGRKMVEAARKYNRIVQSGTQSRSNTAFQEAVAWVRAGNLGRVKLARGLCYKRRASIGKVKEPQKVPANIDYDLWTGPAAMEPLKRERLHYDWHWVWNTGNGDLGNQGIHQMDIARWFLGEQALAPRVFSIGGRLGYDDDGTTPNTQIIHHDYGHASLIFEVRGLPAAAGRENMDDLFGASVGNIIHCENGFVVTGGGQFKAYDSSGRVIRTFSGKMENHQTNFIKAVRSRRSSELTADILEGHISSALCHTGNISHELGKPASPAEIKAKLKGNSDVADAYERMVAHLAANKVDLIKTPLTVGAALVMDPKTERFTNNEQANALLTRKYRAPFTISEKV